MVNPAFKLKYDSIHALAEAFLNMHKLQSSNHVCLWAAVCKMVNGLDFTFLDKVRDLRNGVQYYGRSIVAEDYDEIASKLAKIRARILIEISKH